MVRKHAKSQFEWVGRENILSALRGAIKIDQNIHHQYGQSGFTYVIKSGATALSVVVITTK